MSRQVKNAKDIVTGDLVYFVSHAKATYLGDGSTVEDTVNVMKRDIKNITLSTEATPMVSVTYEELKNLRDNGKLVAGQQYRITDYVTTTTQENTRSAGHQFDIIVTADDVNVLNENARAIQHDGDTYFADSDLNAWQIWYSLDNDAERFAWADGRLYISKYGGYIIKRVREEDFVEEGQQYYVYLSEEDIIVCTKDEKISIGSIFYSADDISYEFGVVDDISGKGVIYRMIDEYSNECPYDFKNIKFYNDERGTDVYTFTWIDDSHNVMDTTVFGNNGTLTYYSEIPGVYSNVIKPYVETIYDEDSDEFLGTKQSLNNITFISDYEWEGEGNEGFYGCRNNSFSNNCYNNSFSNNCYNNSFGDGCYNNSFSNDYYNNSFGDGCNDNSFGDGCYNNSLGNDCRSNIFGDGYYINSLGNSCNDNSFGNNCNYNSFGNNCYNNSFGDRCEKNSFGNYFYYNSFGDNCNNNSFSNNCHHNSFGNDCYHNSFVDSCEKNSFGDNCNNNSFGNGCNRNIFGNRCSNNSFGNNCSSNNFGNDCNNNSFGNNCMSNTFLTSCEANSFDNSCNSNNFSDYCRFNKFSNNCYGNKFGDHCTSNSFGTGCYYNSFSDDCYHNSFGNDCWRNSFDISCRSNSFGSNCDNNSFGKYYQRNSFGSSCENNSFKDSCLTNSFGNYCKDNSFGYRCDNNSLGNDCKNNSFGNDCYSNSFGNDCDNNSFRLGASETDTLLNYCCCNHFDDGCSYNIIWNDVQPTNSNRLQNINVNRGVSGTQPSAYKFINVDIDSEKEINVINYNGHIYVDYGDIFKVTYSELVDLRDNSQLIPGRQYRITDYVTTTGQKNTTSAEHKFDIIVTAINECTLSEDAQAIQNYDEGYFDECDLNSWELKYCLDNDIDRFAWVSREIIENKKIPTNVVYDSSSCSINSNLVNGNEFITPFLPEYYVYIDPIEGGELYDSRQEKSLFYEFGYEVEPNGITENLCIYKSDEAIYQDEGVDYADKFFYRGIKEIDGEEYDYWQKCETSENDTIEFGIFDSNKDSIKDYKYMLTSRIVTGNVEINEYKPLNYIDIDYTIIVDESSSSGDGEPDPDYSANFKLVSYGYELDNNGQKTLVAYRTDASTPEDPEDVNNYRFMPDYEIPCFYVGTENVDGDTYDKWRVISDWDWDNEDNQKYYLTKQIVENGTIKESAFINYDVPSFTFGKPNGQGIIYYMKDEWGNECPYDFKNIKFYNNKRETYVYTFTWIDDSYNVMDTTVFGNNGTLTYYGEIKGVYGNVIKPYMEMIYDEDTGDYLGTKQSLNNITFISNAYGSGGNEGFYGCFCNGFGNNCYDNSFSNNCNNNTFGNGCNNNTFGNYCNYNRFGESCNGNSFGESCEYNSFGNGCYSNSFGDAVSRNTFENICSQNSFGNSCTYNSFGNGCTSNSFGNKCSNNHFGNNCYQNSFGNGCTHNSFGNGCTYNSFGNSCSHNSFGNSCSHNSFGNSCNCNSFGNYCYLNSFRLSSSNTATLLDYCHYNHFDAGCMYNVIWNSVQPTSSNKLQNINVIRGVRGTSSAYNFINILEKNAAYEIKVAKNSKGDIKVYCEADLIE